MSQRNILLIIGGSIGVLLLAGAIWFVFFRTTTPETPTATTNTNSAIVVNQGIPETTPTSNANATTPTVNASSTTPTNTALSTDDAAAALRVARVFIERYGTYSNRNDFENIINVKPFMTSGFQKESDALIAKSGGSNTSNTDPFYGITTTVLSVKSEQYSERKAAQVRVSTQRSEIKGTNEQRTFVQDVLVNMVYSDGSWKVDQIAWQ